MSQSKRGVEVRVTPELVAIGKRCDPCACPVSLAIEHARPGTSPNVNHKFIFVSVDGLRQCLDTPPEVAAAVQRFDKGLGMDPFTFTLEV